MPRARSPPRRCSAFYFAGAKLLLEGNPKGAEERFRRCLETGQEGMESFQSAKVELHKLAGK